VFVLIEIVKFPVLISGTKRILVSRNGDQFTFSWGDLFTSPWDDILYVVHVGTVLGGADILTRHLTRISSIDLRLSSTPGSASAAFIGVTAVDPCGYTAYYNQKFHM